MAKSVLGTLLITMGLTAAIAACGNSGGDRDATAVPTPQRVSAPTALPTESSVTTAIFETPTASEGLTGSAAIDAQLARGWPTAEGWPQPTPEPTESSIDKSDWTVIKPSSCDPATTIKVGKIDALRDVLFSFIDISWAHDDAQLVAMADLVIHGIPVGEIEWEPSPRMGFFSRFYQDVKVLGVLGGQTSADTVRVVQIAFDYATQQENLENFKITLGTGEDYGYPGPLGQCAQILFLNKSVVEIYPSVGLTQGVFQVGEDGRVSDAPEFESFLGLDISQVKNRIEMLAQP